jgi:hypothetical protein
MTLLKECLMEFEKALDEVFKESIGGLALAATILLSSFGIAKQNTNLEAAKQFLDEHPIYVSKLEELQGLDRFDKVTRNKVINQWKAFVTSQNLDPKLSRGLKISGEGRLSTYKSGDLR